MTKIVIEDLDSQVLEALEARALKHNRTLGAELKIILEEAAKKEDIGDYDVISMLQQIQSKTHDRVSLKPKRDLNKVKEEFKKLRETTSLEGLSIREMREEGRRF